MPLDCKLIAHRGYARHYPENTLLAFRAALEAGADAIELDVQFAADGTPMVIHDADLLRVSGQHGQVRRMLPGELARISVHEPGRLGQRHAGECIPTLEAASRLLADLRAPLVFIEIKEETLADHQLPARVQAVLEASRALGDRRVIISFMDSVVQQAASVGRQAVGWAMPNYGTASIERARTLEPDFLFCDRNLLPVGSGALPRNGRDGAGGWEWAIYEVTDPGEALRLNKRGVRYIETMAVADMRKALDAQAHGQH